MVRLRVRPGLATEINDEKLLWTIVSAGFAQRSKTILNNLRQAPEALQAFKRRGGASIILCEARIELQRRVETLMLAEWSRIAGLV